MDSIEWHGARGADKRLFRDMLGSFMTGVTIVAARGVDGSASAFTANSFTSVSLDPPLVLVCLGKSAASYETFMQTKQFGISILGDWQRETSTIFATRSSEKEVALRDLALGPAPYVNGSLAAMQCQVQKTIDAGDHMILLGEVQIFSMSPGQPLGYYRGSYVDFGLAERRLEELDTPLLVGGLLAVDSKVLLCRLAGSSNWTVPMAPMIGDQQHSNFLRSLYSRLGIEADSNFLYSMFQETGTGPTTMIFSMDALGDINPTKLADGTEIRLFSVDEMPWEAMAGQMVPGMLKRYFRELNAGSFGIYCDSSDGGRVVSLTGKPTHWSKWMPEVSSDIDDKNNIDELLEIGSNNGF